MYNIYIYVYVLTSVQTFDLEALHSRSIMGWESSDVVRFDLGPPLQGQMRIAKLKSDCISHIIVANTTKYSHITPVRKSLHWLPVLHRSVFKTALLVYKFLHSGHPKYFEPFLKPRHSVYRTRRSQSDGVLLEVPHCASIYKSKKHFGLSFAYDAPRIWNDLPDDVRSAKSLSSFRKKLKTYLFEKAYPP